MASKRSRRSKRGPGLVASLRDPDKIRVAYIIAGLALVFGGSLGFGAARCDKGNQDQGPSGSESTPYVAEIGDRKITWEEYLREYNSFQRRVESQSDAVVLHPPEWEASIGYTALRQMLDMEYFNIRASEAGIEITDETINAKVEEYRISLVPQTQYEEDRSILQRIGDALSAVKEDKAFETRLRQLDPNLTITRLREIIREEQMATEYVAQLTREKDAEVMAELISETAALREEIVGGASFADIAMENSEHMDSRVAGGLIPLVKRGDTDLPGNVINMAFSLPIDEISLPIEVREPAEQKGYWVVTVISRKDASGEEWEAARETVRQGLLEGKRAAIESGDEEMPEDGNIDVTEDEIIAAYEEATIRVLFRKAEDPMGRVREAVEEDQDSMRIVIYDPGLRAMHHALKEDWALASADYQEILIENAASFNPDLDNQYAIDLKEANIRYLIANLWATTAFRAEATWMQDIWAQFQADPDAFAGEFPEVPEEIKVEEQAYFVIALKNLDRAIELENLDPWSRWQRAQIDLAREQLTTRLIDDLSFAGDYSSSDLELEQRIFGAIDQVISLDDKMMEGEGVVRPEIFVDPVFPEDEMGISLDQLDAPFRALIEEASSTDAEPSTDTPEEMGGIPAETDDVVEMDVSGVEIEPVMENEETGEPVDFEAEVEESTEVDIEFVEGEESIPVEAEAILPDYLIAVPVPVPNGPYSQELRDRLEVLRDAVQLKVDALMAESQAAETERQAQLEEMQRQMAVEEPVVVEEGPSEAAEDLLTGGGEGTEE